MARQIIGTLSTVESLSARLNAKKGMLANLNNKVTPIFYNGMNTTSIKVLVDNANRTISADLIDPTFAQDTVRYNSIQTLHAFQKERARLNIEAVKSITPISKSTKHRLVTHNEDGLVTSSRDIQKDDLPNILNSTEFAGNIIINGDIIQNGHYYEEHAQKVFSKDDIITTRDGALVSLSDNEYTGIVAHLYDGVNDGALLFDNKGIARVGDISFNYIEVALPQLSQRELWNGLYYLADDKYIIINQDTSQIIIDNLTNVYKQYINISQTQPLLTRDEITDLTMIDNKFVRWNRSLGKVQTSDIEISDVTNLETKLNESNDVIDAYIVGQTELAIDWLSLTTSGEPLIPEQGKIYIVRTAGKLNNLQYLFNGSAYEQTGGAPVATDESTIQYTSISDEDVLEVIAVKKADKTIIAGDDIQTKSEILTAFQFIPDDNHYVSEKLIKDTFDTKVDKANGYALSKNDYDDIEKANVAQNTINRHTHSNKTILDDTTASYTTEDKAQLTDHKERIESIEEILPSKADKEEVDSDISAIEGRLDTAEANIGTLETDKQDKEDNYLTTTDKTIVGAINETKLAVDTKLLAKADLIDGKVPAEQLPSYVDDVIEVATFEDLPATGETGKIYVTLNTNLTYRWSGSAYVEISKSLALGENSSTAYRGDRGKTAYDHSQLVTGNPHGTKTDDVSDVEQTNKFVTSEEKEIWNLKEPALPTRPVENEEEKYLGWDGTGNKVWKAIPGTIGGLSTANIYLTELASTTEGTYKQLSYTLESSTTVRTKTVNNNTKLLDTYLFDYPIATTKIDSGTWRLNIWSRVSVATGATRLTTEVFKRALDGTQTILFTTNSIDINNTTYEYIETVSEQPSFDVLETDKIGFNLYIGTTHTSSVVFDYHIGDGKGAYLNIPLALRHIQLRDLNGDDNYLHVTAAEKTAIASAVPNSRKVNNKALSEDIVLKTDDISDIDQMNKWSTAEEKEKVSKIIIDGDGKKALLNDGTYGEVGTVDTVNNVLPDANKNITITADNISDGTTTNKFATAEELAQIATNTSNISNLETNKAGLGNDNTWTGANKFVGEIPKIVVQSNTDVYNVTSSFKALGLETWDKNGFYTGAFRTYRSGDGSTSVNMSARNQSNVIVTVGLRGFLNNTWAFLQGDASGVVDIGLPTNKFKNAYFSDTVNSENIVITGNATGITKTMVGLGNCDNTSDADKPISTAVQTALNFKVDKVYSTDYAYTDGLVVTWKSDTSTYRGGTGTTTSGNGYTGTATKIIIPKYYDDGTNGIKLVDEIGNYAFNNCTSLTSITIPDSVTSIGARVFAGCSSLTSITIPNSVTSIGESTFEYCINLTSITIPNSVTSIGYYAFWGCSSLTSITIPNSVTSIGNSAFKGCSKLTEMTVLSTTPPTLGTNAISAATTAIYVPYSSLTAYKTATNWSTYEDKIFAIPDGKWIKDSIDTNTNNINALNTNKADKATTISGYGITDAYTKTEIESKIASVYKYKGSVANYASLPTVDLTIGDVYNVEDTGDNYAWTGTEWDKLAGTVDLSNYATKLSIGQWHVPFRSLSGTGEPDSSVAVSQSLDSNSIMRRTATGAAVVSSAVNSNEAINKGQFDSSINSKADLVDGKVPENQLPDIEEVDEEYERELLDPKNTVLLIYANPSFTLHLIEGGGKNTRIYWTRKDNEDVTSWGDRTHTYPKAGFYKIVVKSNTETLANMPHLHINKKAYKDSYFEVKFSNLLPYIYPAACDSCTKLISATIPDSGMTEIGNYAFYSCTSLTSITIPNSVTTIWESAFRACTRLTSITIPDSVTSIGAYAFYDCTSLTSITIPNSVTNIGVAAFRDCISLTEMTVLATTPPTLSGTTAISTETTAIYVPYSSLTAYKTATNWSTYADRIFAIPDGKQITTETSKPNLLINSNLAINQRGKTTYSTTGQYTADRWRLTSGTLTVTDNEVVLRGTIKQTLEQPVTGNVVASISANNGSITYQNGVVTVTANGTFHWAKLEVGNVATAYSPPMMAEELPKCQRYFQTLTGGTVRYRAGQVTPSIIDFTIPLAQTLRIRPTVTGQFIVISGGTQTGFTFAETSTSSNAINIRATKQSHGITDGILSLSGTVELDAEIY